MTNRKGNPAVVDGEIKHLSVSAIQRFDPSQNGGCNRNWWFRYVGRVPEPDNENFIQGRAFHKRIEDHLRGEPNKLDRMLSAGLHLLPEPDPNGIRLNLEYSIDDQLFAGGIPLHGSIDCVNAGPYTDSMGNEYSSDVVEILDWKTTSDLKYAKSVVELGQSLQMIGYGVWAADYYEIDLDDKVRLSHVTFQKRTPYRALKTSGLFSVANLREKWHLVDATVEQMKQVAKCSEPTDVTPNLAACSAFGGCPYQNVCPRTPQQRIAELMGGSKMGFLSDKLKGKLAAPTATTTTVVQPELISAASSNMTPAAPTIIKTVDRAVPYDSAECECGEVYALYDLARHQKDCQAMKAIDAFAPTSTPKVNPPDAAPSTPPLSAVPLTDTQGLAPSIVEANKAFTSQPEATPQPTPELPKTRKARTSKAKDATIGEGLTLLIDVAVLSGDVERIEPLIRAACEKLEADHNVSDIRCAIDGPLGFGKWKGVLASVVRTWNLNGTYTLNGVRESDIKQVVFEALQGLASMCVRGV